MAYRNTVLSQLLTLMDRHEFESLAKEHHSGLTEGSYLQLESSARPIDRTGIEECPRSVFGSRAFHTVCAKRGG